MKKRTKLLLLLISISFFSCINAVKKSITPISNLGTDFPVTENLELKPFNKYNILNLGSCFIDGSILWHIEDGVHDFGACYDLNTGERLSVIALRGKATHELSEMRGFEIIGDSVLFRESENTIKTFAKKDIIDNIPMEDRAVSVITVPSSILACLMTKLPNGSVLATVHPASTELEKKKINEANKKSIVIFNNNEVNSYETIDYDSFDVEKANKKEIAVNDLIKWTYAQGSIATKDNDMAVISANGQFILYTLNINNGNVINEKRYTSIQRDGGEKSFISTNNMRLAIRSMKVTSKYILCMVDGYFTKHDKNSKQLKEAIFVFDWDLKTIKKFELKDPDGKYGYYSISTDCSSVYFCEYNEEGLILHKADLNI